MAEQTGDVSAFRGRAPATGLDLIVAGYDTSSHADIAVWWAATVAQQSSSVLRVVWVWHMTDVWDEAIGSQPFTTVPPITELAELAQRRLAAAVDELVAGIDLTVECRAQNGDPAEVLLAASAEADMLFLGSHGRGWVRAALLGSVSLRCIQEATCPVVVIPQHMLAPPTANRH